MSLNFDPALPICHFCGSRDLKHFMATPFDAKTPSQVNIVECRECAFAWQYPLGRSEAQSTNFFEAAYLDKGKSTTSYFSDGLKREIAALEYDFICTLPAEDHQLLDIGAGAGIFAVLSAEKGWKVTALDPALDPNWLSDHPNVTAIRGALKDIPKDQLFDIVTLWDVIEHVSDPSALIEDVSRHIKSGGWLVIETGNYKSADRIHGGINHWIYQLDHRWYFSPGSIQQLLESKGFSDTRVSERMLRPEWFGCVNYPGPSRAQTLTRILRDPRKLIEFLSEHRELVRAKDWPMSGLGIFAMASRKQS